MGGRPVSRTVGRTCLTARLHIAPPLSDALCKSNPDVEKFLICGLSYRFWGARCRKIPNMWADTLSTARILGNFRQYSPHFRNFLTAVAGNSPHISHFSANGSPKQRFSPHIGHFSTAPSVRAASLPSGSHRPPSGSHRPPSEPQRPPSGPHRSHPDRIAPHSGLECRSRRRATHSGAPTGASGNSRGDGQSVRKSAICCATPRVIAHNSFKPVPLLHVKEQIGAFQLPLDEMTITSLMLSSTIRRCLSARMLVGPLFMRMHACTCHMHP